MSGRASAPLLENFRGMKTRIAAIGLVRPGPVRRHPAGPAKLAELRKTRRLDRARRYRKLHFPFELLADVEKHQIGERLAPAATRQIGDVFGHRFHEQAQAELVLDAEHAGANQQIGAETTIFLANTRAFTLLEHKTRSDELINLHLDAKH